VIEGRSEWRGIRAGLKPLVGGTQSGFDMFTQQPARSLPLVLMVNRTQLWKSIDQRLSETEERRLSEQKEATNG